MEEITNNINSTFKTIFDGCEAFANTKRVIGEPYKVGDTVIIPFIETSIGMGVGEFSKDKEAGGAACKITPIACLVIQDGFTKLISIKNQDALTKAIDTIPDLVDKLLNKSKISTEVKESIENLKPKIEK